MVAREVIAARQEPVLRRIREILISHHPEAAKRLDVYHPTGGVPNSFTLPAQYDLFLAESTLILAELVGQLVEANRPKRRGRPPKHSPPKHERGDN